MIFPLGGQEVVGGSDRSVTWVNRTLAGMSWSLAEPDCAVCKPVSRV